MGEVGWNEHSTEASNFFFIVCVFERAVKKNQMEKKGAGHFITFVQRITAPVCTLCCLILSVLSENSYSLLLGFIAIVVVYLMCAMKRPPFFINF